MKNFYERNDHVIDHEVNVLFEELLEMNPNQFRDWVVEMRSVIQKSWDEHGCPPRTGKNEDDIIAQFNKLSE